MLPVTRAQSREVVDDQLRTDPFLLWEHSLRPPRTQQYEDPRAPLLASQLAFGMSRLHKNLAIRSWSATCTLMRRPFARSILEMASRCITTKTLNGGWSRLCELAGRPPPLAKGGWAPGTPLISLVSFV